MSTRRLILRPAEVRALLESGSATVVREVEPLPDGVTTSGEPYCFKPIQQWDPDSRTVRTLTHDPESGHPFVRMLKCPFGLPGETRWVAEAFITGWPVVAGEIQYCDENGNDLPKQIWHRASVSDTFCWTDDDGGFTERVPWMSATQMPQHHSRLSVRIASVAVEQWDGAWCWLVTCERVEHAP